MAHNYKPRFINRKSGRGPGGWLLFLAGLAMGLFVAFVVYLQGHSPESRDSRTEIAQEEQSQKAVSQKAELSPPEMKPRFDFYTILPEMEVKIPEWEFANETKKSVPKTKPDTAYVLQVGSYQRFEDADRTKARLALIGVSSDIHKVVLNGKDLWYRVRIGPFKDLAKLQTTRDRLIENNMNSMLLHLKSAKP